MVPLCRAQLNSVCWPGLWCSVILEYHYGLFSLQSHLVPSAETLLLNCVESYPITVTYSICLRSILNGFRLEARSSFKVGKVDTWVFPKLDSTVREFLVFTCWEIYTFKAVGWVSNFKTVEPRYFYSHLFSKITSKPARKTWKSNKKVTFSEIPFIKLFLKTRSAISSPSSKLGPSVTSIILYDVESGWRYRENTLQSRIIPKCWRSWRCRGWRETRWFGLDNSGKAPPLQKEVGKAVCVCGLCVCARVSARVCRGWEKNQELLRVWLKSSEHSPHPALHLAEWGSDLLLFLWEAGGLFSVDVRIREVVDLGQQAEESGGKGLYWSQEDQRKVWRRN